MEAEAARTGKSLTRQKTEFMAGGRQYYRLGERTGLALLTNNTLFGVRWANLLNGAYDPQVPYSNYCVDMGFYYEHGFNLIFPEFEPLFEAASNDPHALETFGGRERREDPRIGMRYVRDKVALENKYVCHLSGLSAKFDRRAAQCVMFAESSLVGMAVEATTREHDAPATMSDLVFSSPVCAFVRTGRSSDVEFRQRTFQIANNIPDL